VCVGEWMSGCALLTYIHTYIHTYIRGTEHRFGAFWPRRRAANEARGCIKKKGGAGVQACVQPGQRVGSGRCPPPAVLTGPRRP